MVCQIYFGSSNSIPGSCKNFYGLKTTTSAERHAPRPTLDSGSSKNRLLVWA